MKAKVLKRYLAKSDHKHRFQDFTDASRDKNGKSDMSKKSAKYFPLIYGGKSSLIWGRRPKFPTVVVHIFSDRKYFL
jgi:hypothetical protein